jgi:hypothetical protein
MNNNDPDRESFEETVRAIAREVSESVENVVRQVDVDEIAGTFGVDPERARGWVDNAAGWLRSRVEGLGDEVASQAAEQPGASPAAEERGASPAGQRGPSSAEDALRGAGPHPLDVPTEEQGLALAALESGRWKVEPGMNALGSHGEGPGPSDALGLVRELRARDWISADGELTLVGRHALSRWLDAASRA